MEMLLIMEKRIWILAFSRYYMSYVVCSRILCDRIRNIFVQSITENIHIYQYQGLYDVYVIYFKYNT